VSARPQIDAAVRLLLDLPTAQEEPGMHHVNAAKASPAALRSSARAIRRRPRSRRTA
jgi:hypothetical protein